MNQKITLLNKILIPALGIPFLAFTVITIYTVNFSANSLNKVKIAQASSLASNVIDKIDRNYYERFGDVQAFAYNPTALAALRDCTQVPILTDFMNTMASYYVLYDVMMVVDETGKVVAYNTKDKAGKDLNTAQVLKNKNFASEGWFIKSQQHPEGGAIYSEFESNATIASINNDNKEGYGIAFVAPIYDKSGVFKGAWYNFSSWLEITQKIRQEASLQLKQTYLNAQIVITDNNNTIIDADDANKIKQHDVLNLSQWQEGNILESFIGKGAYT